jgi:hypothetical protein
MENKTIHLSIKGRDGVSVIVFNEKKEIDKELTKTNFQDFYSAIEYVDQIKQENIIIKDVFYETPLSIYNCIKAFSETAAS